MRVEEVFGLKEMMRENGMMFCYAGPISQGVLIEIGEILRRKLEMEASGVTVIQKVFGVFVEQVQNIMNYSAERPADELINRKLPNGVIVIGKQNQAYYTLCGNMIEKNEEKIIGERLSRLRKMSREELKNEYKKALREEKPDSKKGAGLGFIEMQRKSSQPIQFSFKDVDSGRSFFSYKVII